MMRKALGRALVAVWLLPTVSLALGLGDIKLASTLNAPLDAQIELLGASPEELASLKAIVASSDTFSRYGLERPAFLNSVTLTRGKSADGRDVLNVRSTDSMTEPFVTLLIEADWARGRLVREYTVLLDPPVFTPKSAAAPNVVIAGAESGATERSGAVARSAPSPAPTPTPAEPEAASPAATPPSSTVTTPAPAAARTSVSERALSDDGSYHVRRGDSLSRIVGKVVSADRSEARQAMVAIYRANPTAFGHNMNDLRSGAVLRIPDPTEFAAVPAAEASREVRDQYQAWRERTGAAATEGAPNASGNANGSANANAANGRLRLVTPGQAPSAAKAGGNGPEVEALRGQVHDLESQLADSKRLLEMRNADLAALQAKLAGTPKGTPAPGTPAAPAANAPAASAPPAANAPPPTAAPPVAAAPPAAAAPPVQATPPTTPAPVEAPPPAASAGNAAPPPVPVPARPARRPPHPAVVPPVQEESLFDSLEGYVVAYWYVPVALIALILGVFGFRKLRDRRKAQFDDRLGRLAGEPAAGDMREIGTIDTSRLRRPIPSKDDESFLVEESGTHERPTFAEAAEAPGGAVQNVRADETMSGDPAMNLDQGDPLAEADFHMAYGLYDQAADLVRMAIAREPQRRDLKLKLLEVFFVWGNRDQFLVTAHELAQTRAQAAPGEWDKIVIMGKQIAPEDPLFSAGVGVSGAAAAGVDLDLEGGQNRVDFDLLGEPGAEPEPVVDVGRSLTDHDPTGEAQGISEEHIDFLLDDPARGADASGGTTREMTAQMPPHREAELPTGAWSAAELSESPTVEQPAVRAGDNPTVRQKVEHALRQSPNAERTAEVPIDDLGLDLSALEPDHGDSRVAAESPTMVAGLDARSRKLMEDAERRASGTAARGKEPAKEPSESGTWFIDEESADTSSGIDLAASIDPSSTAQIRGITSPVEPPTDPGATSQIAAMKVEDLDLDFSDEEPPTATHGRSNGVHRGNGTALDLDVGTVLEPVDSTFIATQQVAPEDLALPDLEPVTMSEVGTKLDLARAYMDMGDPEGARNILHEVLTEGSVSQKQEAQRLIASLPG
jgi:pilus assembly protein FimV